MAEELSQEEQDDLSELEHNFDKYVAEYKQKKEKQFSAGNSGDLKIELENINSYLDGIQKGEIDDVLINVKFYSEKAKVLKQILEKK